MPDVLSLKNSKCNSCHKCVLNCPVKSVRFTGNRTQLILDECVLCGQCFVVCPQEAVNIVDDSALVIKMLKGNAPVIASVDPSFYACWDRCGINSIRKALVSLGFDDVEEAAIGAAIVKREYERQIREEQNDVIISSSCHSVNMLVEKHFPELRKYLSPTVSPMIAHAMDIKRRLPEAKVVFIGPCVAKKDEAKGSCVDAVLTFEEFDQMRLSAGIEIEPEFGESFMGRTRGFPIEGGIISSMFKPDNSYLYLPISGAENCIDALRDIRNGKIEKCFIEMSACAGSCIDGPIMQKYINSPVRHMCSVLKNVGTEDFDVPQPDKELLKKEFTAPAVTRLRPSEAEIRDILAKIGKPRPQDDLDCGSCGYNTCREKAIAVYRGNADNICLPYLRTRTESLSNKVLNNMPSGVILLNEDLEIEQLNRAALRYLMIDDPSEVIGQSVVCVLDTAPFFSVLETGKSVKKLRSYFSEYRKYFEQTIVYDRSSKTLLDIFSDVTEEEEEAIRKKRFSRETADIADNVIANQMRIVQEIASLLGETTAETKVALTRLKESLSLDDEEEY